MIVMKTDRLTGFFKHLSFPKGSKEVYLPRTSFTLEKEPTTGSSNGVGFGSNYSYDIWFSLLEVEKTSDNHIGILIPNIQQYTIPFGGYKKCSLMRFNSGKVGENPKSLFTYLQKNIQNKIGIKIEESDDLHKNLRRLFSFPGEVSGEVVVCKNVYSDFYFLTDIYLISNIGSAHLHREEKINREYFGDPEPMELTSTDVVEYVNMKLQKLRIGY